MQRLWSRTPAVVLFLGWILVYGVHRFFPGTIGIALLEILMLASFAGAQTSKLWQHRRTGMELATHPEDGATNSAHEGGPCTGAARPTHVEKGRWSCSSTHHLTPRHNSLLREALLPFFLLTAFLVRLNVGGRNLSLETTLQKHDPQQMHEVDGQVIDIRQGSRGKFQGIIEVRTLDAVPCPSHLQALVNLKDDSRGLKRGNRVFFQSRIKSWPQPSNPFEFDYGQFLSHQGIRLICEDAGEFRSEPGNTWTLASVQLEVRERIEHFLAGNYPETDPGILYALLLGDKQFLDRDVKMSFAVTGTIHTLAVSGLHVGYVAVALYFLAGILRLSGVRRAILTILGLGGYVFLTGAPVSVIRASIMAAVYLVGGVLQRPRSPFNVLAAAGLLILLMDPGEIETIGFQLSFSAVFGILSLYPRLENWFPSISRQGLPWKMMRGVRSLLLVSIAAQLATLPLSVYHFQRIPLLGSLANLIVVPLAGVVVSLGLAVLVFGWMWSGLALAWSNVIELLIRIMIGTVQFAEQLPLSSLQTGAISPALALSLLLLLLLIGIRVRKELILIGLLGFFVLNLVRALAIPPADLEWDQLDVGQGDAAILHTRRGETILIDAGPVGFHRNAGSETILPFLERRGWRQVDLMILTHPHSDHIGGAGQIMRNIPVKMVWAPDLEYKSRQYHTLKNLADSLGIPWGNPVAGCTWTWFGDLKMRVLAPVENAAAASTNDHSIVIQAFLGRSVILLTGDAELPSEEWQKEYGSMLAAAAIKIGHHGSATSSGTFYLQKIHPNLAIISVGRKNKFGHPAPTTLGRLASQGIELARTDREGAIVIQFRGGTMRKLDWRRSLSPLY